MEDLLLLAGPARTARVPELPAQAAGLVSATRAPAAVRAAVDAFGG